MKALKNPLALITFLIAFGIITAKNLQLPLIAGIGCCLLSLLILLFTYFSKNKAFQQKSYFIIGAGLFSFSLGLSLFSFHHAPNSRLHYSHLIKSENSIIEGSISQRLKPTDFYEKYIFKVKSVNGKKAIGKILLNAPKNKRLHTGDRIILTENPLHITKPLNPYVFDYASYMANQNIFDQYTLKKNYIISGKVKDFNYYIGTLRHKLEESFTIHRFSPQVSGIVKALLLGQRQDIDTETTTSYKDAGVMHILAISGLHIAILFFVLNFVTTPLKKIGKSGRLLQFLTVLLVLWSFAFISGMSPSVVRAVIMFSFISIGLYINRSASSLDAVIVSMFFMLIISPKQLFDVGFQLSYAAVTGIIIFQPFCKKIHVSGYRIVNYFTDLIVISAVAQISVLPLTLYYFGQFPTLFLAANIVIIPFTTAILILGMVTLVFNFINFDIAAVLGKLLSFLIEAMNSFTAIIASFDTLTIKNIPFTLLLCILLYSLLTALTIWIFNNSYRNTIAVLATVLVFQCTYITTKIVKQNSAEFVVFHNYKNTMMAVKNKTGITIINNDSTVIAHRDIVAYRKGNFNPKAATKPFTNTLWHNGIKIYVLDSFGVYSPAIKPGLLIVTQSPKVNFEEIITDLKPKAVITDGTNYKNHITRWKATCKKYNIPFHATAEKGYYSIE